MLNETGEFRWLQASPPRDGAGVTLAGPLTGLAFTPQRLDQPHLIVSPSP